MAKFYAPNYKLSTDKPNRPMDGTLNRGELRILADRFELGASFAAAANDCVVVGELPEGARVLSAEVWTDALGAGAAYDLGTPLDPDRFLANVAASAAAATQMGVGRIDTGFLWQVPATTAFDGTRSTFDGCVLFTARTAGMVGTVAVAIVYTDG